MGAWPSLVLAKHVVSYWTLRPSTRVTYDQAQPCVLPAGHPVGPAHPHRAQQVLSLRVAAPALLQQHVRHLH